MIVSYLSVQNFPLIFSFVAPSFCDLSNLELSSLLKEHSPKRKA